jgi:hypothetical protein
MFVFVWFSWWWWWWLLVCWTLSGSLFLFLSRLLLLSSTLFKLLLFPLSGSGDKNLVSALVSYTDPMRILSEEGDGQSKKTMGNCCCLGSSFVFLPPSVIRTDHSGWDSLFVCWFRLLFIPNSDDRSHFPIIHFHIFSLGITGGPINYRSSKSRSVRLFSNHSFVPSQNAFLFTWEKSLIRAYTYIPAGFRFDGRPNRFWDDWLLMDGWNMFVLCVVSPPARFGIPSQSALVTRWSFKIETD